MNTKLYIVLGVAVIVLLAGGAIIMSQEPDRTGSGEPAPTNAAAESASDESTQAGESRSESADASDINNGHSEATISELENLEADLDAELNAFSSELNGAVELEAEGDLAHLEDDLTALEQ